jgi:hypothetical protein
MQEFLLLFRNENNPDGGEPSPEQMQAAVKQWQAWIQGIAAKGIYSGTNRLQHEGKTLYPENIIKDGPFAEVKEVIGGYLIIKAESLVAAVEIAKACPNLVFGGNVEVRPVLKIDDDPRSKNFLAPIQ